ncbi:hypothetical protein K437DRAFT_270883 [Tilletiaria anomala UBC 951]|uniref:separase n=1 Tax=Tilletiaria anomala (strain ATCC 24038 / CBS 436.72 / UBC 951) TaxID=1037660 RepID=A0A066V7G3_TILAU|nr:uncharacterized protein K437DRAFT_270883 [Tilletiaria anomala UBC 951]KDN37376.1 hypothetical protein K437DRAFT_270883 [Tilletiaria anomala UBC 951]
MPEPTASGTRVRRTRSTAPAGGAEDPVARFEIGAAPTSQQQIRKRAAVMTAAHAPADSTASSSRSSSKVKSANSSRTTPVSRSSPTAGVDTTSAVMPAQSKGKGSAVASKPSSSAARITSGQPRLDKAANRAPVSASKGAPKPAAVAKAVVRPPSFSKASQASLAAESALVALKTVIAKPASCTPSQSIQLLSLLGTTADALSLTLLAAPKSNAAATSRSASIAKKCEEYSLLNLDANQKAVICKNIINATLTSLNTLLTAQWSAPTTESRASTARSAIPSQVPASRATNADVSKIMEVTESNVKALADGLRISAKFLLHLDKVQLQRRSADQDTGSEKDGSDLKLENVLYVFVRKLQGLGLNEVALAECADLVSLLSLGATTTTSLASPSARSRSSMMTKCAALIPFPLASGEFAAEMTAQLRCTTLLVQVQALALTCALSLAHSREDLVSVSQILAEEFGPLGWQRYGRALLAPLLALQITQQPQVSPGQVADSEVSAQQSVKAEQAPAVQILAAELLSQLDRVAYSIERHVSRTVERLVSSDKAVVASASSASCSKTRTIIPSAPQSNGTSSASGPSPRLPVLDPSSRYVLQARHRAAALLLFASNIDMDVYWDRAMRFGHNHMRYCKEAWQRQQCEQDGGDRSLERSSVAEWNRDNFVHVHEVYKDLTQSATRLGKLDKQSKGFVSFLDVWSSLATKAGSVDAFNVIDNLAASGSTGEQPPSPSQDLSVGSPPKSPSKASAIKDFSLVQHCSKLRKAALILEGRLNNEGSHDHDVLSALEPAQFAVLAICSHLRNIDLTERVKVFGLVEGMRKRAQILLHKVDQSKTPTPLADPFASPTRNEKGKGSDDGLVDALLRLLLALQSWYESMCESPSLDTTFTAEHMLEGALQVAEIICKHHPDARDQSSAHAFCEETLGKCRRLAEVPSTKASIPSDARYKFLHMLSNAWYRLGHRLYHARQAAQAQHFLRTACDLGEEAESLAKEQQVNSSLSQASREDLSRKWEHMAICYRAVKQTRRAVEAHARVLSLVSVPTWQALAKRAASLSTTSIFVEKPFASLAMHIKAIVDFTTFELLLSLNSSESFGLSNVLANAPHDAAASLLEHAATQLLSTMMHREGCAEACSAVLGRCAQLLSDAHQPLRLARIRLREAELSITLRDVEACATSLAEAEDLLQRQDLGQDWALESLRSSYIATACLLGIIGRRYESSPTPVQRANELSHDACQAIYPLLGMVKARFSSAQQTEVKGSSNAAKSGAPPFTPPRRPMQTAGLTEDTGKALGRAPLNVLTQVIDDPVHLAKLLETAEDFLGAFGHSLAALEILKVSRRLRWQMAGGAKQEDGFLQASASLARQYVFLGRLSRASSIIKTFMHDLHSSGRDVLADTHFRCLLASAEHLIRVGSLPDASERYERAVAIARDLAAPEKTTQWERCRHRALTFERQAAAASVFSSLALAKGDLATSISAGLASMKRLMRAVLLIKKFVTWDAESGAPLEELFDAVTVAPATKADPVGAVIAAQQLYWCLSRHLSLASHRLSCLYSLRGSAMDAELFASETNNLTSKEFTSSLAGARSLIHRAELRAKLNQDVDSRVDLERAFSMLSDLPSPEVIDHALVKVNDLSKASRADALSLLMSSSTILKALDAAFAEVDTALPSPAPPARLSAASTELGKTSRRSSINGRQEVLPEVHARLLRRQAWLMHLLNSEGEAKRLLEEASAVETSADGRQEGALLRGRIAMKTAESSLSHDRALATLADAAIAMPLVATCRSSKMAKSVTVPLSALSAARKDFSSIVTGADGVPHSLLQREAGTNLVLAGLIESSLGKPSLSLEAISSALAKSVSVALEREYAEALRMKVDTSLQTKSPDWFASQDEAKAEHALHRSPQLGVRSPELESDDEDDDAGAEDMCKFWKAAQCRLADGSNQSVSLPDHWTVISVSYDRERNSLIISRRRGDASTMVFSIPIDRQSRHEGEEHELTFDAVLGELSNIVKTSNTTVHAAKDLQGMDARKKWWTDRRALDHRMKEVLQMIEESWLGWHKALFAENAALTPDDAANLCARLDTVLRTACLHGSKKASKVKFQDCILELFFNLAIDCPNDDLEDMLRFFADAYLLNGVPIAVDEIDFDRAVVDLRSVLEESWAKRSTSSSPSSSRVNSSVAHTFLILDKDMCSIPWESMQILRRRSVSRIPSLVFLQDRLELAALHGVTKDGAMQLSQGRSFYVLNPSGDLKRSEERFRPWVQRHAMWKGITGREPIVSEFADALATHDLLMYFGHSGGEQFIAPSALKALRSCAVTMLWGCSSGMLRDLGEFDRTGTPYLYMMAGAPALVANLWDTTDRELDKVSESTLVRLGLMKVEEAESEPGSSQNQKRVTPIADAPVTLPLAIAQARDDCRLPFLTGAACVVYGIPVEWKPLEESMTS